MRSLVAKIFKHKLMVAAISIIALIPMESNAIYGPSLARADRSLAIRACQEAGFSEGRHIVQAIRTSNLAAIESVLGNALKEWRAADQNSTTFPAKSFCIHELIPDALPRRRDAAQTARRFQSLGIIYSYYEPDGAYRQLDNPVDLNKLARLTNSQWGRQAFLMMIKLGWSQGGCQEGPDQFKAVIAHGEKFLERFSDSEIAAEVRLEVASAYSTWWNLSLHPADEYTNPEVYKAGAEKARLRAIKLYRTAARTKQVSEWLAALEASRSTGTYDYFCPAYED